MNTVFLLLAGLTVALYIVMGLMPVPAGALRVRRVLSILVLLAALVIIWQAPR